MASPQRMMSRSVTTRKADPSITAARTRKSTSPQLIPRTGTVSGIGTCSSLSAVRCAWPAGRPPARDRAGSTGCARARRRRRARAQPVDPARSRAGGRPAGHAQRTAEREAQVTIPDTVLILFAVMLTQAKNAPVRLVFQAQALPAAIASIVLAVMIALTASATDWGAVTKRIATGTDALARLLFTTYILPFEVVSVLLLAAVIGGIYLAKREGRDA